MRNVKEIIVYINERIAMLTDDLKEIESVSGTNCIGYAYDDGSRDELLYLRKFIHEEDN